LHGFAVAALDRAKENIQRAIEQLRFFKIDRVTAVAAIGKYRQLAVRDFIFQEKRR